MLKAHGPKKVLVFFGDNLLTNTREEVLKQFKGMAEEITAQKYKSTECFFLTPTYEMEVSVKRNVPAKNLENTLRVIGWIKEAVGDRCQVIDGVELMKNSSYHLDSNLMKRVQVKGLVGCDGGAKNDNIHLCGEAATEFAERVCARLAN